MSNSQHPEEKPLAPGLYLVATPIGNLEDIPLRALRVLRSVDRIACEDTRQTQKLLNHYGIEKPTVSYHLHNEAARTEELIAALQQGGRIAIVSDAGMPGIADPGALVAQAAIAAGVPVFPIPGANAALSALVASGLPTEQFSFHGFLPARQGQRRSYLEALAQTTTNHAHTLIFYEAPHRIAEALADVELAFGPAHRVVLARELTKLHEEFLRGTVAEVRAVLEARDNIRGEMVLLLEGRTPEDNTATAAAHTQSIATQVAVLMQQENLSKKDALKRVARERGIGKSEAYRELQREKR
jgi:16S rRNA (cytidine1402-2'-O)-methyltransferase